MADAGRLKALSSGLGLAVLAFIAASFVLPTGPAAALVFYVAVLPCLAARLMQAAVPRDTAFWLGVALIVWSGLTLMWGRDDSGRALQMAAATGCTLAFWWALQTTLADTRIREQLAWLLVVFGAADALVGIWRFVLVPAYVVAGDTKRLHGWGVTLHPVLGAVVLSVCFLTALDMATRNRRHRACNLGAAAVIGTAILLAKSRGPELAVALATLVLLGSSSARRWIVAALALLPLGWLEWRYGFIRTGDSGHVAVWRAAWAEIGARPWLGNGLAANMPASLGPHRSFPHDLYLSLLFYSGVVGFGLFAVWIGLLGRQLIVARAQPAVPWLMALLVNALAAGVTDFGQITKGPGPLWFIIWLPAALVTTLGARESDAAESAGP